MRRTIVLTALLLALPGAASAQDAQTPPAPPPGPPPATLGIQAERVGSDGMVLSGARWRVSGQLSPAAPNQSVVLHLRREGSRARTRTVPVGPDGRFVAEMSTRGSGRLTVRATHDASPELGPASSRAVRVSLLPRRVGRSSRGLRVRALQRALARLGYVTGRRGSFDARTGRAVLAFRKVTGMRRTSVANRAVMSRLARGGGRFRVRHPGHGKHVEADLSRQVIALIRGRRVERIYPTSSGSTATPTIRGSFRFYRSQPGYNAKGMYMSEYFIRGYAIHGFASVPIYPASHGCLRVPIPDAVSISRWIDQGDRIDVYG
jgi:hypothetical protein